MLLAYPTEHSPSEKLTVLQLVKEIPAFYGTLRFISASISATYPHPEPEQSNLRLPTRFPRSVLILSSHLRLYLPRGVLPHVSSPKLICSVNLTDVFRT